MALFSGIKMSKNGTYYVSGQLPADVNASLAEQTQQALAAIKSLLDEKGLSKNSIMRVDIFTTEIDQIDVINDAYAKFFDGVEELPTRNAFGVTGLVRGAKVELNCIGEA